MAKDSEKPKKRVVKKAETVRERAEKGSNPQPKRRGVIRLALHYIGAPFRFVGRQIAKLGKYKFFRFVGKILLPTYFRNSWKELRQVTWPTRRESLQLTLAVIIFATLFGLMIAVVDFGLDKLFKEVLLK